MNDLKASLTKFANSTQKYIRFISKYRIVLLFLIGSGAILFALIESRAYLNPTRDEDTYIELRTGVNYSEIDESIVEKLSKTQQDENIEVDASLVPNRSNPFKEN